MKIIMMLVSLCLCFAGLWLILAMKDDSGIFPAALGFFSFLLFAYIKDYKNKADDELYDRYK